MTDGEPTPGKSPNLMPPWQPGQSGNPNGRPKGARAKLGEAFIDALKADFDKHGIAALKTMRGERPADYIKVVASLLPKELTGEDGGPLEHNVNLRFVK